MISTEGAPKKRGRPPKAGAEGKSVTSSKKNTAKKTAAKSPRVKSQGKLVFALDIGTRTIVGIIGEQIEDKFRILDIEVAEHYKRAMIDGQIEDIEQVAKVAKAVREALEKRNKIKLSRVSIAAAGRALKTSRAVAEFDVSGFDSISEEHVKSMEIEAVQKAQALIDKQGGDETLFYCVGHTVVRYELDDYKLSKLDGHKGSKATVEVIAAFLPSPVVESLYAVMDRVGLEVSSMTLEPIAAMNVIIPPEIRLINIALVDIGAGTSDIAVARDGAIVAYGMATVAGDEITEEIVKTLLVDFNMAESMKQSEGENVLYRDIFGITHEITSEALYEKASASVNNLADMISSSVVEANGKEPQAVFLVGGGSRTKGLAELVAKQLSVDPSRVAVGSTDFIKNLEYSGGKLGPEFVTPIGIAVTEHINQGYDFSTITLNGEKIRVFNKKQLTVFELFTLAGIKSAQVIGRSGKSVAFTVNGVKKLVKGEILTPAEIRINNQPASLNSTVTQGDKVGFVPAVSGEDAHAKISEFVDITGIGAGTVEFGGEKHKIGTILKLNGMEIFEDREIQSGDEIEVSNIHTLGDLLSSLQIEMSDIYYSVGGIRINDFYKLCDGDVISFGQGKAEAVYAVEHTVSAAGAGFGDNIEISLNGRLITLPAKADGSPYMFLELFNYTDIDVAERGVDLVLTLNGLPARFSDPLKSGDTAVIK